MILLEIREQSVSFEMSPIIVHFDNFNITKISFLLNSFSDSQFVIKIIKL